jgi:hypothetical protein
MVSPVAMNIIDLGYGPSEEELEEQRLQEAWEAAQLAEDEEEDALTDLDPEMRGFVDELCKRVILFCEELWGEEFYPYQRATAYRIIESLVLQDAEEMTGLWSRQSGKSETVSTTLAGCMILFPILAKTYPILSRFKNGLWVGLFAPVDEQSELVYRRIIDRLSSDRAAAVPRAVSLGSPTVRSCVVRPPTLAPRSKARRTTSSSSMRPRTPTPKLLGSRSTRCWRRPVAR